MSRSLTLKNARHVLLPVETAARELDGKLLLALFAAEAGLTSHIGVMSRIQAPGFPPSIYVSKSVRFAKQLRLMRDLGHIVVSWDEEGLARYPDAGHSARIEPEAFHIPQLLFSWGESNTELWQSHPAYDGTPIITSGNPRIDLLRPELRPLIQADADRRVAEHGSFVLLNSNFGLVNHFKAGGRKTKVSRNSHDAESFVAFQAGVRAHKRKLLDAFLAQLPVLAKSIAPNVLVVRPHPSEGHAIWQEAAGSLANVKVIHEGPVAPWLLAARCLVHNGCTSAVEASILGLPALAFQPFTDATYDIALPNALSQRFQSMEALGQRASALLKPRTQPQTGDRERAVLIHNVASLDGPFACERIVEGLKTLAAMPGSSSSLRKLAAVGRHAARRLAHQFATEKKRYEKHKSDASIFTARSIENRAIEMGSALNRFGGVRFQQFADGVVSILPR